MALRMRTISSRMSLYSRLCSYLSSRFGLILRADSDLNAASISRADSSSNKASISRAGSGSTVASILRVSSNLNKTSIPHSASIMSKGNLGQMTIEFVIAFPVALIIALVAINTVLFFSECAAFDRSFRSLVCTYASSPAYEQDVGRSCAQVSEALHGEFDSEQVDIEVSSSGSSGGLVEFKGTLQFSPTLFGKGSLSGVFGVSFPSLTHQESIVVDVYKPGVFL